MDRGVRKVLIGQCVLVLIVAASCAVYSGTAAATAALYGGAIAMLNAGLLAWRVHRAGQQATSHPKWGQLNLYIGLLERLAITAAGFVLGLVVLRLPAWPQVAAFALAQLGYLAGAAATVAPRPEDR